MAASEFRVMGARGAPEFGGNGGDGTAERRVSGAEAQGNIDV